MERFYYWDAIKDFLNQSVDEIIGKLTQSTPNDLTLDQKRAWNEEIDILKEILPDYKDRGSIFFEYNIPRMGRRIDVVLLIDGIIFVLEFKAFQDEYLSADISQTWDYALDLKNFHEGSHNRTIFPILVSTKSDASFMSDFIPYTDQVYKPLLANRTNLACYIQSALDKAKPLNHEDDYLWAISRYAPTPTIIEAATALYNNHSVADIAYSEAKGENLTKTCDCIADIIVDCKTNHKKGICFVTGVPGAGKTLVGLTTAIKQFEKKENAVYLSGNFPLVAVLTEALSRDLVARKKKENQSITKKEAQSEVKSFIQMIHHYRDACLEGTKLENGKIVADQAYFLSEKNKDKSYAPIDHIAIFDEAQRAWTKEMLVNFMARKKGKPDFPYSEPEYLISCLDRHQDWALIICLVGGGQEINTGEAGIKEWIDSLNKSFTDWQIYISDQLTTNEYANGEVLDIIENKDRLYIEPSLHLSVSMRSFRAENLSLFVYNLLNQDREGASKVLHELKNYPIVLTRSVEKAKEWLRNKARGSERFGLLACSSADRIKPLSLNVRFKPDEVHWFLDGEDDVRSSNYLEDVATEFQVQGLELDWTAVVWDADMRYNENGWQHYKFNGGTRWNNIRKPELQSYQTNAYRVLLTRARQGMIIVVPEGNPEDKTRDPKFYQSTYEYLKSIGIEEI